MGLAAEIDTLTGAWFREDKWPTATQYRKLFLPGLHVTLAGLLTLATYWADWNLPRRRDGMRALLQRALTLLAQPLLLAGGLSAEDCATALDVSSWSLWQGLLLAACAAALVRPPAVALLVRSQSQRRRP